MLKRLAEYMEKDDYYRGHFYRLGGDEFVLFFAEPVDKFSSLHECREYFRGILLGTLRNYSIPYVRHVCTISMGVSFLPWQGTEFSELLHKADKALYQAKKEGRNRICFFEEESL